MMANLHLTPVPNEPEHANGSGEVFDLGRGAETGAQRIRRLQQEARILAREQVEALAREFFAIAERARDIAQGGEVYPVGVRELASRIAEDIPQKAQVLMTIMERTGHG
jgi:hypothetical protein